ncbi:hypothetical protein [Microbacterium deminutum]|uniref:Uncharacterized protein n=1 Tax=Microbacterium deminutum TaxID=344164 RepID=A0ABN2R1Y5_9MICO
MKESADPRNTHGQPDADTTPGEVHELPDTTDENGRPVDNPSG